MRLMSCNGKTSSNKQLKYCKYNRLPLRTGCLIPSSRCLGGSPLWLCSEKVLLNEIKSHSPICWPRNTEFTWVPIHCHGPLSGSGTDRLPPRPASHTPARLLIFPPSSAILSHFRFSHRQSSSSEWWMERCDVHLIYVNNWIPWH